MSGHKSLSAWTFGSVANDILDNDGLGERIKPKKQRDFCFLDEDTAMYSQGIDTDGVESFAIRELRRDCTQFIGVDYLGEMAISKYSPEEKIFAEFVFNTKTHVALIPIHHLTQEKISILVNFLKEERDGRKFYDAWGDEIHISSSAPGQDEPGQCP